ncbi:MAG TPA: IPT/TIG domain-containing protein [Longimicrobium sp.]|nr:IPT/TIG domain-containing protein [Longimicrobium sp.]
MRRSAVFPAALLFAAVACSDGNAGPSEPLVPVLTSVSPATVPVGSADATLTLIGSGFARDVQVRFTPVVTPPVLARGLATTWVSETELRAVIPAAQMVTGMVGNLSVFSLEASKTSGDQPITIAYAVPALTALSHTTATRGQANPAAVTVTGTGFAFGTTVVWAGQPITTLYQTPTSVYFIPPVTTAGTFELFVRNPTPGGGSSTTRTFTVQAP